MRLMRMLPLLLLSACATRDDDDPAAMQAAADSARAAIRANIAAMQAHFNAGHFDSLAQFYTNDAVSMPPNQPAVTGPANIVGAMRTMMGPMQNLQMHFTTQSVTARGDIAIERGRYHMTFNMGGQAVADSGKYLTHWRKVGDRWLTAEEIFNSDVALEPPADSQKRN